MSIEKHLILQETVLRPSGEWVPGGSCWTIARVAEGSGYWMQGGNTRALDAGDGLMLASNAEGRLRASQLGMLKLEWFTVQPQFLNGLLTVMEWHQLKIGPSRSAPHGGVLHFKAGEPAGQKFAHIANQTRSDGLTMRCALLQLWANAVSGLLVSRAVDAANANKLRERFRQVVGQMLEAELSGSSLGELAARLRCSERHFSRLFREEFGVPLRARQIELRLQRARQLLADSDAKIISVAYDSGYRHLGLFNAMFKKRFGATPSEWRQQNARKNGPAPTRNVASRPTVKIALLLATLAAFLGLPAFAQPDPAPDSTGAKLRTALTQKMSELDAQKNAGRTHVIPASTNSGPGFRVDKFIVEGNTILPAAAVAGIFTNVPAAFGTNVAIDAVLAAAGNLQAAYRERGYMTVVVGLPRQQLTNGSVRVTVTEAPIVAIKVEGNRWFSSNNVMRALPDLHTNILLNAKIFQRELDTANMSRDRTIRPIIEKGPVPGTSALTLKVDDRLPWHARLEVNNQATPGTPDLRANFSSQYDDLWGLEHQIGLQYGFSFNQFKGGANYNSLPFDAPQVANYSAYYRMPLGGYPSVQNEVESRPGSFGYNEATHLFNLPAPAGRPELTFYGSRATSDTGVQFGPASLVTPPTNHLLTIFSQDSGDNLTLNENMGGRLSMPLPQFEKLTSTLSVGFDFKRYRLVSYNSNNFVSSFTYTNQSSGPTSIVQTVSSAQPTRRIGVDYLPLNAGWSGSLPDKHGTTFFNTSANFNPFAPFSRDAAFKDASYSRKARADYVVVQAGADRQQTVYKDWTVRLHADGQWADGPLFSSEQYAMGGVGGVRGYTDGEAYGDEGWRVTIEPQLPPLDIGLFGNENSEEPCWLRSSVFMDYGETYLLDPPSGGSGRQKFWGVGWGVTVNIGTHLDSRVSMAFPLTATPQTPAGSIHLYFGVGGQF